jgi:hypothetical protein
MENEENENLTADAVRELQLSIRYVFINYPVERLKVIHWELYRGWVYNSAVTVSAEEITDMLMYYEMFEDFIDDLFKYCQHLNKTALKDSPVDM